MLLQRAVQLISCRKKHRQTSSTYWLLQLFHLESISQPVFQRQWEYAGKFFYFPPVTSSYTPTPHCIIEEKSLHSPHPTQTDCSGAQEDTQHLPHTAQRRDLRWKRTRLMFLPQEFFHHLDLFHSVCSVLISTAQTRSK